MNKNVDNVYDPPRFEKLENFCHTYNIKITKVFNVYAKSERMKLLKVKPLKNF